MRLGAMTGGRYALEHADGRVEHRIFDPDTADAVARAGDATVHATRAEDIPDEYWQRYGMERAELR